MTQYTITVFGFVKKITERKIVCLTFCVVCFSICMYVDVCVLFSNNHGWRKHGSNLVCIIIILILIIAVVDTIVSMNGIIRLMSCGGWE